MKKTVLLALAMCAALSLQAQQKGSISSEMLKEIEDSYVSTPADKAIRNALNTTSIAVLAENADNAAMIDTHFSDRVRTKGITDQKS